MTNRYWDDWIEVKGKLFVRGRPKCSLTNRFCLYPYSWCSQCPIEYKDASYEEALAEKVGIAK